MTDAEIYKFASEHNRRVETPTRCVTGVLSFARAIEAAACAPLLERIAELEALSERLKIEAQCHAQEARTANATIAEIYQLCSGRTGEPGTQRVPAGWMLVPCEPTEEMIDAGCEVDAREQAMEANRRRFATAAVPLGHDFSTAGQELRIRYTAMLAAGPAAPEQQEPDIRDAVKRSCPLCEESWYEFAEGTVAQAPNAQQATPSCESKTVDSESQPSLSARGSQQEQSELPPGWKTVVVPEEVGPEPDWEDVRYQAETATGIELPRAVFSIVIREVRRWLAAQQAEAQPVYQVKEAFVDDPAGTWRDASEGAFYASPETQRRMLYASPPKAVPLTHAQINAAYGAAKVQFDHIPHPDVVRIVRAVEAAHGIVAPT